MQFPMLMWFTISLHVRHPYEALVFISMRPLYHGVNGFLRTASAISFNSVKSHKNNKDYRQSQVRYSPYVRRMSHRTIAVHAPQVDCSNVHAVTAKFCMGINIARNVC